MAKIILIRGNSGSGKTTVAKRVHKILGEGNLLISQDVVRREMLRVRDRPNNLSIGLIKTMIEYGLKNCEYVIVEGILAEDKYGEMLRKVLSDKENVFAYYYDLSFEETVLRHKTKIDTDFGEEKMKLWFAEKDFIGLENERSVSEEVSEDEMVNIILDDLGVTV